MQKSNARKNENHHHHKSIFSCNVYPTNNDQSRPAHNNSKGASGTTSIFWKDPEVLYLNEKIVKTKKPKRKDITDSSTQTSKTIIQLAQLEAGGMSPDSLAASPRRYSIENCPYSVSNHLSDYTLEGSCEEQDCIFSSSKKNSVSRYLDKPLTQTFLENKSRNQKPNLVTCFKRGDKMNHLYDLKSKSLVERQLYQHPNYIQEVQEVKPAKLPTFPLRPKSHRRSSRSLDLPDNSFVRRRSSSICYAAQNTFMFPTTASQIKNQMPEIQSTNYLIPPMRRGRSTSPKPSNDKRRFESSRRIPYIDQSKSDVSSSTTIINTTRFPDRAKLRNMFDEDLLKVDDLDANASDAKSCNDWTTWSIDAKNLGNKFQTHLSLDDNVHPSSASTMDNTITVAVARFREPDWRLALRGLAEIVEICRLVDIDLIYDYMTTINQRLIELLKSPRSHVCRTACQGAGHLFEYVKDTRRPEFDDIVDLLLHKTADANKFIRHDANLALDCMVTHISTFNAIRALCSKGPFHKNPLVRTATARLIICAVVIAGPDFVLNPNNNEYTRKRIILNLARFLEDKSLETRKLAERLYKVLCKESRFDVYLKKYLEKEQIAKIKKTLRLIHKK